MLLYCQHFNRYFLSAHCSGYLEWDFMKWSTIYIYAINSLSQTGPPIPCHGNQYSSPPASLLPWQLSLSWWRAVSSFQMPGPKPRSHPWLLEASCPSPWPWSPECNHCQAWESPISSLLGHCNRLWSGLPAFALYAPSLFQDNNQNDPFERQIRLRHFAQHPLISPHLP